MDTNENTENNRLKEMEEREKEYRQREFNDKLFIGSCVILSRGGITVEQAHQFATQLYNIIYKNQQL